MGLNNLGNKQSYKISVFDKNLIKFMDENDKDLLLNSVHIEITKFVQAKKGGKIMRDLYRKIQVKGNDFLDIFEKSVLALKDNGINRDFLAPYREKYNEKLEKQKEEEKKIENIRKKSENFFESSKKEISKFDSEFKNLQNELFLNNDFEKLARITRLKDLFLRNETLVKNFLIDKNPDFIEEFGENLDIIMRGYDEILKENLIVYIFGCYSFVKYISSITGKPLDKYFNKVEIFINGIFEKEKKRRNSKNTEEPKERIEKKSLKISGKKFNGFFKNGKLFKLSWNNKKYGEVFIEGDFDSNYNLSEGKMYYNKNGEITYFDGKYNFLNGYAEKIEKINPKIIIETLNYGDFLLKNLVYFIDFHKKGANLFGGNNTSKNAESLQEIRKYIKYLQEKLNLFEKNGDKDSLKEVEKLFLNVSSLYANYLNSKDSISEVSNLIENYLNGIKRLFRK